MDYLISYVNISDQLPPADILTLYFGAGDVFTYTSGNNFSGASGGNFIYTGAISTSQDEVSGLFPLTFTALEFTGTIDDVGISFPIYDISGIAITGSGTFPEHIFTGLIDVNFTSGLVSGKLESTGQINFENIWGFSTGKNLQYMVDHKYYNYYNSTGYVHSGSNGVLPKNIINHNIVEVTYDGYLTSGTNIAQMILTDSVSTISLYLSGTGRLL
jgi:hypothetical protein